VKYVPGARGAGLRKIAPAGGIEPPSARTISIALPARAASPADDAGLADRTGVGVGVGDGTAAGATERAALVAGDLLGGSV
jgi:hypothetical protein